MATGKINNSPPQNRVHNYSYNEGVIAALKKIKSQGEAAGSVYAKKILKKAFQEVRSLIKTSPK